ncbi:MAG: uroporphyrinogen-III C-methyltransferase [Litorilinea sp.]
MKTIRLEPRARRGKAFLIGAGPGNADLITVRGLRLLQRADVVVYDRLIAQELLDEARADAEQVFVGKAPGRHTLHQTEINALLVDRVRQGKQVVRLKGGDPFVFGRGGEEALALVQAGLAFEVVPGVSSALAAPAYAGIPVTQRGVATAFAVVTGHECADHADDIENGADPAQASDYWRGLAAMPTLVILMGVSKIAAITAQLLNAGKHPQTPAAAISWATTAEQQVVTAPLAQLPATLAARALPSPAVIVIGDVAALHDSLDWFRPAGDELGFVPMPGAPATASHTVARIASA